MTTSETIVAVSAIIAVTVVILAGHGEGLVVFFFLVVAWLIAF